MAQQSTEYKSSAQTIIVASRNPVKINAVKRGFARMFPAATFTVDGTSVPSDVPDQPLSDSVTLRGALNRAENARAAEPTADYWVGVEGGVDAQDGVLQNFAWVVVKGRSLDRTGKARTAAFCLPEEVALLVKEGMELGDAQDRVFGRTNSKQAGGTAGLLTDEAIDRTEVYEHAVILALIPFKNVNLTFPT